MEGETKKRDSKVKQIWSEGIGAFANSGGGVLIWGIKAKNRLAEGIDRVADVPKLAGRLRETASYAVDPPALGVEVLEVRKPGGTAEGFVVCFIPASTFPPHRALWATREYYLRVQDGNIPMPTTVLRRMFYPRTSPHVLPIAAVEMQELGDHPNRVVMYVMQVSLQNRGTASARELAVRFQFDNEAGRGSVDNARWSRTIVDPKAHYFRSNEVLHPEESLSWLTWNLYGENWTDVSRSISFRLRIFARDAEPLSYELRFTYWELAAAFETRSGITRDALLIP